MGGGEEERKRVTGEEWEGKVCGGGLWDEER